MELVQVTWRNVISTRHDVIYNLCSIRNIDNALKAYKKCESLHLPLLDFPPRRPSLLFLLFLLVHAWREIYKFASKMY
jgi:hypothetical protein